jgi:ABC-type Fe3+/spermidine/putrescine transport system ATPase subunit
MRSDGADRAAGAVCGAAIRLEGIGKEYGPITAVRNVTVDIGAGEFFTLLGPSGSGKTTLLQLVAGFTAPSRGELFIDGSPMSRVPPQRRDLGMVFQSYALFPHLNVFENVAFPLRVRRADRRVIRQQVDAALALVRLEGLGGRLPRQLSGGQQQRVAVARALVFRPRALLMDEPLGALDRKLREEMQLELKQLHRQVGATFIYVTHDQEEALRISDRMAVMRGGGIEQIGGPRAMYDAPATPFVAEFLGTSNFVRGVVRGSTEAGDRTIETDGGGRLVGLGIGALREGQSAIGSIRPERIQMTAAGVADAVATGRIEEIIYAGDATLWRVRTDELGILLAKEQNVATAERRREGDRVALCWRPADVRIFVVDGPSG